MAQAGIVKERIELKAADGPSMQAYVARPASGGPYAGLLVFQEAFGVNSHIRNVTERFAEQGYVAVAPELFHRTAPPGYEGNYMDFPSVMPHYQAVTNEAAEADVQATYEWLRSNSQVKTDGISCVGFCMGAVFRFWQTAWFHCERQSRSTEVASLPDCWTALPSSMGRRCWFGADWTSTLLRSTVRR